MHRISRPRGAVCLATAGVLLAAACASGPGVAGPHRPSRVDARATTAGNAMSGTRGPLPARAAALSVTGSAQTATTATTISALVARGDTWNGTVVLRIVVESRDGLGATHESSACFRYRFRYPRTTDSGVPTRVACRHRRPIDLHRPPLPNGITDTTRRTAARVVAHAVAGAPVTAAAVEHGLARALGPDYTYDLGAEPHQPTTVDGFVRYGDQCLMVHVVGGVGTVTGPFEGNDCFGG